MNEKTVHIGFTGSRVGLTVHQSFLLTRVFSKIRNSLVVFHHGDCTGSDTHACRIARDAGFSLHSHPCNLEKFRAFIQSSKIENPLDPLVRNRALVEQVRLLIACPGSHIEERRSGTWAAVRYARLVGCARLVVWPDGSVKYEK